MCLSSAACGEPPATFDVNGRLSPGADEVSDKHTCLYGDTRYHVDDEVVLRGADNNLLAVDRLHSAGRGFRPTRPGQAGECDLAFTFHDVRPGDVGYQLTVGGSRRIVVSEAELRVADFQVIPRGHGNNESPDFDVPRPPDSNPQPKS
jgi:hypothetical protein